MSAGITQAAACSLPSRMHPLQFNALNNAIQHTPDRISSATPCRSKLGSRGGRCTGGRGGPAPRMAIRSRSRSSMPGGRPPLPPSSSSSLCCSMLIRPPPSSWSLPCAAGRDVHESRSGKGAAAGKEVHESHSGQWRVGRAATAKGVRGNRRECNTLRHTKHDDSFSGSSPRCRSRLRCHPPPRKALHPPLLPLASARRRCRRCGRRPIQPLLTHYCLLHPHCRCLLHSHCFQCPPRCCCCRCRGLAPKRRRRRQRRRQNPTRAGRPRNCWTVRRVARSLHLSHLRQGASEGAHEPIPSAPGRARRATASPIAMHAVLLMSGRTSAHFPPDCWESSTTLQSLRCTRGGVGQLMCGSAGLRATPIACQSHRASAQAPPRGARRAAWRRWWRHSASLAHSLSFSLWPKHYKEN